MAALNEVAIIGCGLSGLCLALSLQKYSIKCVIYEQRADPVKFGGSITLFPNGLSVLDHIGVYDSVHSAGYDMEETVTRSATLEVLSRSNMSNKDLFGYKTLRIRRDALLKVLMKRAQELGITMNFEFKFSHVVSENEESVLFEFTNGEKRSAAFLVGADGVHSKVRQDKFPDTPAPTYHGEAGFSWTVPKTSLSIPAGEDITAMLLRIPQGIALFVNDDFSGKNMRIGVTRPMPDKDREGWERFSTDKAEQLKILGEGYSDVPEILKSALKGAETTEIFVWPFRTMPSAPTWLSPSHRVIIIGDAAHAFPPAGGQGGGMGIEDAYTLAFSLSFSALRSTALKFWQHERKHRVQQVVDHTLQVMKNRKGMQGQTKNMGVMSDDNELIWLYNWRVTDFERALESRQIDS